jgi:uncharacterized membrane protein YGL010W
MKNLDTWIEEYSVSHKNPSNKKIHNICVPLIMLSILGMLWEIPTPESLHVSPYLNWATIFILICQIFYFSLGMVVGTFMTLVSLIMLNICYTVGVKAGLPLLEISIVVFVLSWIGQFVGHKIEGKKPSFFEDIQFLLIGPLWVFHPFFSKFLK